MTITLEIDFPLGRYHATPWDRHVNEGAVEWPPSPWRLARAFYAVWKERCPDLDESDVLEALDALAAPPTYFVPRWSSSATRHYYPAGDHRPPAKISTDKVVDAFVAVDPAAQLALTWEHADLAPGPLAALGQLASALPFLGRADSVCTVQLSVGAPAPLGREVFEPAEDGDLNIAAPARPLQEADLVITTDEMRKRRLRQPPGMVQIPYRSPSPSHATSGRASRRRPSAKTVNAAVFSVSGHPAPQHVLSVAVAEAFFGAAQKSYTALTGDPAPPVLSGHAAGESTKRIDQHRHAHVWPIPAGSSGAINRIVVWAEEGFEPAELAALGQVQILRLSKRVEAGGGTERTKSVVQGLNPSRVLLAGLGLVDELMPRLGGSSTRWASVSPFLPNRHQKPRHGNPGPATGFPLDFLREEIDRELGFRFPGRAVSAVEIVAERDRPEVANRFRRYRLSQGMASAKRGVWLRLHFDERVSGPISLGALSHFGLGLFEAI